MKAYIDTDATHSVGHWVVCTRVKVADATQT